VFTSVKSNWFELTPESSFLYYFTDSIIKKYGVLDDTSYLRAREFLHTETLDAIKSKHGPKTEILHNELYEKFDVELNHVLRDMVQNKSGLDAMYSRRTTDLRDTILSIYNQEQFVYSLSKAQSIIKAGGRVEEAYLEIKVPEPPSEIITSFEQQAKVILSKKIGKPIYTTIEAIDGNGGIERGNVIAVGGDTGVMKTRLCTWLCLEMLYYDSSLKCVYFQREMTKRQQFYLVCQYVLSLSYKDVRAMSDEFLEAKLSEVEDPAMRSALDRFIMLDSEDFMSAEDIYHEVQRHKPDIWVVDFLTMMISGNESSDTNLAVYQLTDNLKETAKRTDSVGILVSQIKKGTVEARSCKMPRPDDLEWSGRLKHVCANIFMVFYPNYYDYNVDNSYYIIEEGKSRFAGRAYIYLNAAPWVGKFNRPSLEKENEIRGWYQDYRKNTRK